MHDCVILTEVIFCEVRCFEREAISLPVSYEPSLILSIKMYNMKLHSIILSIIKKYNEVWN